MDFETEETYVCSPGRLHELLTDRAFVEARLEATGGGAIVEIGPRRVVTTRQVKASLPSFAATLLNDVQTVTQTEEWADPAVSAPEVTGVFSGKAPGTPVAVSGSLRIHGDETSCTLHVRGHVEVKVPFVGGKIAELVREQIVKNLRREHAFTVSWLTAH